VIVYVGAVMVLYVFVVAYVGGGRAAPRAGGPAALGVARCSPARCSSSWRSRSLGTGLSALDGEGAAVRAAASARRRDRAPVPDHVPARVRGRVAAAAVAAVGAVILAPPRAGLEDPREISVADCHARRAATRRRAARDDARGRRAAAAMSIEWYLVVSALIFCIGAAACSSRRNPLADPALPRADAQRRQPRAGHVLARARQRGRPDLRADRDGRRGL
jgi:hypothetical protein